MTSYLKGGWRTTGVVAFLVILQALAAVVLFGTRPAGAWFGSGSCPMPFTAGQKCLAVDNGVVEVPWKGEIILPRGTTSITDHALYNGTHPIAGTYQLQLVEDNGTCCTVYQTIDYTVAADGSTSPASFPLGSAVITEAFTHHAVGTGGLVGYFIYISNGTPLPAGADCQNTVSFAGAAGSLGSATSATGEKCSTPTPVPGSGALAGHIYDCTTGMPQANDLVGGHIAISSGPQTHAAAANPVSYPVVPTGSYVETATLPAGFHFVYTCGGTSQGTDSVATTAVTVPLQGTGVANFYAVHDSGLLVGHIYDCTGGTANLTADIPGGSVGATGPVNETPKSNPAQWSVPTGSYVVSATAPAGYHMVACNGAGVGSQTVTVLDKSEASVQFYVARDAGTLGADIYDCTGGVIGKTDVAGGTVSASGATPVPAQANPLPATTVNAGPYTVTATTPAGYHFVACADQPATGTRAVTVTTGGAAQAVYYVTHNAGTLDAHILDCTGGTMGATDVPGGTVSASGPTPVPAQANPLATTAVNSGDYVVSAVAPTSYHLVACGDQTAAGTRSVTVPNNGAGHAVFYVTHDTGTLGGHIYDCTSGATSSEVPAGTLAAAGATSIPTQPNPFGPVVVQTGPYTVTATAPSGYTLAACNGLGAGGSRPVTVTAGTPTNVVFYVTKNPVQGVLGSQAPTPSVPAIVTQAVKGVQGVLGAATTQPNTGRGDMARAAIASLLLIAAGGTLLAATRRRRATR